MPNPTNSDAWIEPAGRKDREIAILHYPGCQMAMAYGITDLVQTASDISARSQGTTVQVTSWRRDDSGAISRTVSNNAIDASPAIIIIPGRLAGPIAAEDARPYAEWLKQRFAQGSILASNCGGAFLLAETGLLAGRSATTHWRLADDFRLRFPDVQLDIDQIVIDDGDILTAGGLMAWTDLGLHLIRRFFGHIVMLETARYFLIDTAGREQRHYAPLTLAKPHLDTPIRDVENWLQREGANGVSVSAMAQYAKMEERTFLRRFKAATGVPPSEYAQRLRLDHARNLLQTTQLPISQIAWKSGYEDLAAFGRLFHRRLGLSPGDYRRRFSMF